MADWNKEQTQVIESRNANILVSAAAGSGKTTVLVERILGMVMDENDPSDIDDFLVVTFTNAAAAQMREKIEIKLEKAIRNHPENTHLVKQLSLIHKAEITTIDSFLLRIVKEHFHSIGIDSSFSIIDNHLMDLLKDDVLDQVFQTHYEDAYKADTEEDQFLQLVRNFTTMKEDDKKLKEIIQNIYKMAMSFPNPEEWLLSAKENNHIETEEELNQSQWVKAYISDIHRKVEPFLSHAEEGRAICDRAGGCGNNAEVADRDILIIRSILEAATLQELRDAFQIPILGLKAVRKEGPAKENYILFSDNRKLFISSLKDMIKESPLKDISLILEEIKNISRWTDTLVDLCLEYMKCLAEEKKKKRQYEFSDISHMALQILCQGYDEKRVAIPTQIGRNVSERYRAIFIDEYQDSNYIQEDILTCVSKRHAGIQNMFMVGDVKQSIYRFRMARPDLFLDKFASYVETDEDDVPNRLINLKTNYRSRSVVLDAVNYIFENIMKPDMGGILYDADAALKYGDKYQETDCNISDSAELLFVTNEEDTEREPSGGDSEAEEMSALEYEAYAVAKRIKELTDPEHGIYIWDDAAEEYVRASYKHCMILLRSVKYKGSIFERILRGEGIPVSLDDPNGYFDAMEVRTMLSMLAIIDNIRQDIPLAAVLLSPMVGLTNDEMAFISACSDSDHKGRSCLYDNCCIFVKEFLTSDRAVYREAAEKLQLFLERIEYLKQQKSYFSISVLIREILKITKYDIYISALPQGSRRIANINMLMEKAEVFEHGDYRGLFNFLRYMEKIKIHNKDFGEACEVGEQDDVVRITTMHKSKGMEYPIVFVSGLGQEFKKDKDEITIHQDYYIATEYIDPEKRVRHDSFMQDVYKHLSRLEGLAEEQRILYVAMTRAKEKLILTASVKIIPEGGSVDYNARSEAKRFLDWIIPCVNQDETEHYFKKNYVDRANIVADYSKAKSDRILQYEDMKILLESQNVDREVEQAKQYYDEPYMYQAAAEQKVKMSVTEIKKMQMYAQNEDVTESDFIKTDDRQSEGARRGTVIHKLMELLPFRTIDCKEKMKEEFSRLLQMDIFEEEDRNIKGIDKAAEFFDSDLFRRMKQADEEGRLYKEKQFTIGIPANEIKKETQNMDMIVVQGIIDAYFYEDDEIVLMDYKTDAVRDGKTLVERYQAQLDYYAGTLERLTGRKVKEKLIYSFALNEVIVCE